MSCPVHLADVPDKRVIRYEVPPAADGAVTWRWVEERTDQPKKTSASA
ncbi:MAG: hypothetical protein H7Y15_04770 [Pseudonocardia sp.]|nr:hypothetical protein [Pseudonocardia sp.]